MVPFLNYFTGRLKREFNQGINFVGALVGSLCLLLMLHIWPMRTYVYVSIPNIVCPHLLCNLAGEYSLYPCMLTAINQSLENNFFFSSPLVLSPFFCGENPPDNLCVRLLASLLTKKEKKKKKIILGSNSVRLILGMDS
jgi:hypothetical protein